MQPAQFIPRLLDYFFCGNRRELNFVAAEGKKMEEAANEVIHAPCALCDQLQVANLLRLEGLGRLFEQEICKSLHSSKWRSQIMGDRVHQRLDVHIGSSQVANRLPQVFIECRNPLLPLFAFG
jgi:hypothetical protein